MYFTNTAYRLRIDSNLNLAAATSLVINFTAPYDTPGQWTATPEGKTAYYDIPDTLIDRKGLYKMQLVAVIDGNTRRSNVIGITFETPL